MLELPYVSKIAIHTYIELALKKITVGKRLNKRNKKDFIQIIHNIQSINDSLTFPTHQRSPTNSTYTNSTISTTTPLIIYTTAVMVTPATWKISLKVCPSSDHDAILYHLNMGKIQPKSKEKLTTLTYDTSNINWETISEPLTKEINSHLLIYAQTTHISTHGLDNHMSKVIFTLQKTHDKVLPRAKGLPARAPWWNDHLEALKIKVIRNHHTLSRLVRRKLPLDAILAEKLEVKRNYSDAIRKFLTEHFKEFCNDQKKGSCLVHHQQNHKNHTQHPTPVYTHEITWLLHHQLNGQNTSYHRQYLHEFKTSASYKCPCDYSSVQTYPILTRAAQDFNQLVSTILHLHQQSLTLT